MNAFLPLSFIQPIMLLALFLLPLIWWLLRLTPPKPHQVTFPPTQILKDIGEKQEISHQAPWWLRLLRLALVAILIFALSGPIWRGNKIGFNITQEGSFIIIIDNGWTSAAGWDQRIAEAHKWVEKAERYHQPILIIPTSSMTALDLSPFDAKEARRRLAILKPQPYKANRLSISKTLSDAPKFMASASIIVWLADGVDHDDGSTFAKQLVQLAPHRVHIINGNIETAAGLVLQNHTSTAMNFSVFRLPDAHFDQLTIQALDLKKRIIDTTTVTFEEKATSASSSFELPAELRNEITRLDIIDHPLAGAVQLVDEQWRRRRVGLIANSPGGNAQPLLAPNYYLERALQPFSDIITSHSTETSTAIGQLIQDNVSVIMLTDTGILRDETRERLHQWTENGGILVRFAGPRLAATSPNHLVPVRLRGDRSLGGSLSWATPQPLARFHANSPLANLTVPDDVIILRQVLAEPDPDIENRIWANLADGTPIITAQRQGYGWVILFHVTADTRWSNLPLSGIFVKILKRIVALASHHPSLTNIEQIAIENKKPNNHSAIANLAKMQNLPPLRELDGWGHFRSPSPTTQSIPSHHTTLLQPNKHHPPGFYGEEGAFRALNITLPATGLQPLFLDKIKDLAHINPYSKEQSIDLRGWFFALAFILILLDSVITALLFGRFSGHPMGQKKMQRHALIALLMISGFIAMSLMMSIRSGYAQTNNNDTLFDVRAALKTRLAYVLTGNIDIDENSRRGLEGLSTILAIRTALEPGKPIGIDIKHDELAFYPLLYWPIAPNIPLPNQADMERVDAYMKNGGSILFDTRDQLAPHFLTKNSNPAGATVLQRLLASLDIPELEPVSDNHVLTKAFYLLQDFPGRYRGSPLWVEALTNHHDDTTRPIQSGDGVSPILITANDFAGAWALTSDGRPLNATIPPDPHQRELAYRVGINIVMYVLTGNYKADQVHIPALLERLGQ